MSFTELLHQVCFGLMIVAAVVAVAVSVERLIFTRTNFRRARDLLGRLKEGRALTEADLGHDVVSGLVSELKGIPARARGGEDKESLEDAAYLHARDALDQRLWVLDTVVTAAPLPGLLGTIFGIVETFLVLSSSGMSDPAGVSAGIGTALYATALGISIALVGLLCFNYLSRANERLAEHLKMIILKTAH